MIIKKETKGLLDAFISKDNEESRKKIETFHDAFKFYNNPTIYAFQTDMVKNAIKVGSTNRPVTQRLKEWGKHYPDILLPNGDVNPDKIIGAWPVTLFIKGEECFFEDHSVHNYLIGDGFNRLTKDDFSEDIYFSKEFFSLSSKEGKELTAKVIEKAIEDIKISLTNDDLVYAYYKLSDLTFKDEGKAPDKFNFDDTPRQAEVINEIEKAAKEGVRKILLAAVMRFGKSHVTISASDRIKAKITVVTSAKADVRNEWRRAIYHERLHNNRLFVEIEDDCYARISGDLSKAKDILSGDKSDLENAFRHKIPYSDETFDQLVEIGYSLVFFGTLQDLCGEKKEDGTREIKTKHSYLFSRKINLLVNDETHFGARADVYGKVIGYGDDEDNSADTNDEKRDYLVRALNVDLSVYLSGTPYKVLQSGEFDGKDCRVIRVTYLDQLDAHEQWVIENDKKDNPEPDYYNPLFGLPRINNMGIRLTEGCRKIVERELNAKHSLTESISALFKIKHSKFVYEKDLKTLFRAILGDENDRVCLLDDSNREIYKHIVCALPSAEACHLLKKLLKELGLDKYFEIMVAVKHDKLSYSPECENADTLNKKLAECENKGQRTLTLTCYRLLTGTTIPLWDTCLFFRGGDAAEFYDQVRFRIASICTVPVKDKDGNVVLDENGKEKKVCKKNVVFFFDFQVDRMLSIDYPKVKKLAEDKKITIEEAFKEYSDKVCMYDCEHLTGGIRKFEYKDMLSAVHNTAASTIIDIFKGGEFDSLVKSAAVVNHIQTFGKLKAKNGNEKFFPSDNGEKTDIPTAKNHGEEATPVNNPVSSNGKEVYTKEEKDNIERLNDLLSKLTYFVSTLDVVIDYGISQLISYLDSNKNEYTRLANNYGITRDILVTLEREMSESQKDRLITVITNITLKLNDKDTTENDKLDFYTSVFKNIPPYGYGVQIPTCKKQLDDLNNLKPLSKMNGIVEVASFCGEYVVAAYQHYGRDVAEKFYIIPLTDMNADMAKKICRIIGLPESIVLADLVRDEKTKMVDIKLFIDDNKNKNIKKTLKDMKIDAIVGNPPYQITVAKKDTKNGQKRVSSIFHLFQLTSEKIANYTSLIYPGGRWIHRSGKGLSEFGLEQINDTHLSKMEFFPDVNEIFEGVELPDGISIVLKDTNKTTNGFEYVYTSNGESQETHMDNPGENLIVLNPTDKPIVENIVKTVEANNFAFLHDSVLPQKLFGIESDFVEANPELVVKYDGKSDFDTVNQIKLFTNDKAGKRGRASWYLANRSVITNGVEYLDKWKVVVSSASPGGQKRDNQIAILDNHSAFGRTRVALKTFETETEARNFFTYANSELIRFAFLMTDESLTSLAKKVPDILDYTDENPIIDFSKDINPQVYELFGVDEKSQEYIKKVLAAKCK